MGTYLYCIISSIALYFLLAPSAPSGVAVSEATGSNVRVTWTALHGDIELLAYQVSFERLPGRGCDSLHNDTKNVSSTTTDYTVTGLSGLSAYRISVAAANIFGLSMGVTSTIFDSLPTRESWVHVCACFSFTCNFMYIYTMHDTSCAHPSYI